MRELRWPLLVFLLCLPIIVLASGVRLPWLSDPTVTASPLPVPSGDQEIAWIHTTTNATTWERFVTGVMRTQMTIPGLHVDDSRAFLDSTTATPELVLSKDGFAGRLRIRWYKLQNEVITADWVRALANRTPAPIAVIGGGSTDRALDLARAMAAQADWRGDRPPLLITTATADFSEDDGLGAKLRVVDIYDDHTFRFCFTNRQMADAVVEFVAQNPDLKPLDPARVPVLTVSWADDRYSVDLRDQFTEALKAKYPDGRGLSFAGQWTIKFSVGGFVSPNVYEAVVAADIAERLRDLPDKRVLMVLPGITLPARRLLKAVVEADPVAAGKLVVLTGDGIPTNALLRDGDITWPVGALPVPLVLFAHGSPSAWDAPGGTPAPPNGYRLSPPNGTEEVMHFGKMVEVIADACFSTRGPLLTRGDDLRNRLRERPDFFNPNGERNPHSGEHVVVASPRPEPTMSVWRSGSGRPWVKIASVPLDPRKIPAEVRP
jgi:hypothetical protein